MKSLNISFLVILAALVLSTQSHADILIKKLPALADLQSAFEGGTAPSVEELTGSLFGGCYLLGTDKSFLVAEHGALDSSGAFKLVGAVVKYDDTIVKSDVTISESEANGGLNMAMANWVLMDPAVITKTEISDEMPGYSYKETFRKSQDLVVSKVTSGGYEMYCAYGFTAQVR